MRPSLSETMVFLSEMQKAGRSLPRTACWSFRSKTVNYDLPSPQLVAGHFDVRLGRGPGALRTAAAGAGLPGSGAGGHGGRGRSSVYSVVHLVPAKGGQGRREMIQ